MSSMESYAKMPTSDDEAENNGDVAWDEHDETLDYARRASLESFHGIKSTGSILDETAGSSRQDDDLAPAKAKPRPSYWRMTVECVPSARATLKDSLTRRRTVDDVPLNQTTGNGNEDTSWDDLGEALERAMMESLASPGNPSNNPNLNSYKDDNVKTIKEEENGPAAEAMGGAPWNCSACTFLNENPLHLVCGVCGTAKAAKSPPLPPVLSNSFHSTGSQSSRKNRRKSGRYKTPEGESFTSQGSYESQGLKSSLKSTLKGSLKSSLKRSVKESSSARFDDQDLKADSSELDESFTLQDVFDCRENDFRGSMQSTQSLINAKEEEFGDSLRSLNNSKKLRFPRQSSSGSSRRFNHSFNSFASDDISRASSKSSMRRSTRNYRKSTMSVEFDGLKDEDSVGSSDPFLNDDKSYVSYSELSDDDDRTTRTFQTIKSLKVPEKEATIIYTDVQGSTSLWESHPLAMKKATDIHDSIIRKCYADHGGYEISTEGDSFNLAFQHPADALMFALKAQLTLYKANWPEDILGHPDGCFNEKKAFRGFRVRMGMHHGPVENTVHETTGRTIYHGEAVDIAKSIEKMSHGGQILATVETWRAVSGMAEQFLGKPQVMDCGEHLLFDPKKKQKKKSTKSKTTFESKRIVQIVPNELAYDFFAARGGQEVKEGETPPRVCGRVFPPLLSHGQLSTSFLNAPFVNNRVAMVFVYTDKMESAFDNERKKNQRYLAKYIRRTLMQLSPPGYECQEDKGSWMLAFDRIENGIKFGLELNETVSKSTKLKGDIDKEKLFKIGIHWGPFISMGPHTITGHADYFGPIGEHILVCDCLSFPASGL